MTAAVVTLAALLATAIGYIVALEILLRRAHSEWQKALDGWHQSEELTEHCLHHWRHSDEVWQAIVDAIRNDPASPQENP